MINMDDDRQIQKITQVVLKDADQRETDAGFSGSMSDGGASRLREQVKFFTYGLNRVMPSEWQAYQKQLDPEYQKYLELKKKFG